jgi:hypothetical protein
MVALVDKLRLPSVPICRNHHRRKCSLRSCPFSPVVLQEINHEDPDEGGGSNGHRG